MHRGDGITGGELGDQFTVEFRPDIGYGSKFRIHLTMSERKV